MGLRLKNIRSHYKIVRSLVNDVSREYEEKDGWEVFEIFKCTALMIRPYFL